MQPQRDGTRTRVEQDLLPDEEDRTRAAIDKAFALSVAIHANCGST